VTTTNFAFLNTGL